MNLGGFNGEADRELCVVGETVAALGLVGYHEEFDRALRAGSSLQALTCGHWLRCTVWTR